MNRRLIEEVLKTPALVACMEASEPGFVDHLRLQAVGRDLTEGEASSLASEIGRVMVKDLELYIGGDK